jgi:hypothetical protein
VADLEEIEARDWLIRSRDSKSPSLAKAHATSLLAYIDALVAERDEWEVAAKKISGARNRWKKRAEAAEAAARRVPALDAEIDRLGAYCRTQDAEVARLREALGVIADYYEAVYAPGDQAYQAAIVARAALGDDA